LQAGKNNAAINNMPLFMLFSIIYAIEEWNPFLQRGHYLKRLK